MATRRDKAAPVKKNEKRPAARRTSPTGKAAPRTKAARTRAANPGSAPASRESSTKSPKGFLRAGLTALGTVRDDVVKHQTNVIESILGIGKSGLASKKAAATRGLPALDLGLRKFEDVFDQRVAAALQRLGLPSAREVQALREQVHELLERIELLEGRKAPARPKR